MSSISNTPLKIVYFKDVRARVELIRYILVVAGAEWVEDNKEWDDWSKEKASSVSPNKMLPYMEIEGKIYTESIPMARFLAKKHGLSGKTDLESLSADMLVGMVEDIRDFMYIYMFSEILTQEQQDSMKNSLVKEKCPVIYQYFEKTLSDNPSGFLVGDSLTYADLSVADINDQMEKTVPGFHDNYPKVKAHWEKVKAWPKLVDYLAKRKDMDV